MIEIVTLEEAKLYIRVGSADEDFQIDDMIQAATEAALAVADGWDGVGDPPARLKLAILAHVASIYDGRDNPEQPAGATRLIASMRNLDV